MRDYSLQKQEERRDQIKSGVITAIVWSALLLFVFFYTVQKTFEKEDEVVSTMLVNFGDNRNGNGQEEPANQEGSQAAIATKEEPKPIEQPAPEKIEEPAPVVETKKAPAKEKIVSGTSTKAKVSKSEKDNAVQPKKSASATKTSAKPGSKSTSANTPNAKTGSGDGKGNAALGNLIRGRGTKAGTQGDGGNIGNAGDPLGGDGNGDSKIGIDRKLVSYIPGTMGRGGAQPSHNCSASGSITIAYTVDKAGNVVSASRSGGISDACIVSTSVAWVKRYVKAEKAPSSSTGNYRITF